MDSEYLKGELARLRHFYLNPKICLADYFDEIRNQVDLYYTSRIQAITKELSDKRNNNYQLIIEKINLIEKRSVENIPASKDLIGFEKDLLNNIEIQLHCDSSVVEDRLYKALVKLRGHYMRSISIVFLDFSYEKWIGQLVIIQGLFIGSRGVEHLKHMITNYSREKRYCSECYKLEQEVESYDSLLISLEESLDERPPIFELSYLDSSLYQMHDVTSAMLFNRSINALDSETFRDFKSLETIDLSHNLLKDISKNTFKNLNSLLYLYLQSNKIVSLERDVFDNLKGLVRLQLANNLINKIDPGLFCGLSNLSRIDLSHNQIERIEAGTFNRLPSLLDIDLSHNRIVFIHEDNFNGSMSLKIIKLKANSCEGFLATFEPFIMMKFNFLTKIVT